MRKIVLDYQGIRLNQSPRHTEPPTPQDWIDETLMSGTDKTKATLDLTGPVVILVEPQLGENIGTAARAMFNCGLTDMRLVKPRDGWPSERAKAAASGADIVLDNAKLFDRVEDAVADLRHVFATTARDRDMVKRVVTPREAAAEMRVLVGEGRACGILFGPERSGTAMISRAPRAASAGSDLRPEISTPDRLPRARVAIGSSAASTGGTEARPSPSTLSETRSSPTSHSVIRLALSTSRASLSAVSSGASVDRVSSSRRLNPYTRRRLACCRYERE